MTAYERRMANLRTAAYYTAKPDEYAAKSDDELAAIAADKGVDVEGKTRKQVIAALKKAV